MADKILNHVDHEERIALGALMDNPRKDWCEFTARKPERQIFTDLRFAEKIER